jgi:hypothetical protein
MDTIFISYRREESAGHAGRIYDRLQEKFGKNRVFMDVSAIEPGVDFVEAIDRAVGSCAVLLVVIGRQWLEATDATGRRRLDDTRDFIRLEVGTALKRNIRVVPVLVQNAAMPGEDELPDDLKLLARRNAIEINDTHWDSDLRQLIETLERVLSAGQAPAAQELPSPEPTAKQRKTRLTWLISSITAVFLALAGLFTGIDSFRNSFVKLFKGEPAVTTTTGKPPVETTPPAATQMPTSPATVSVPNAPATQPSKPPQQPTTPKPPKPSKPAAAKVVVPSVVGQTLDKASSILKKQGFSVEVAGENESRDVPAGSVLRHFPKAGDKLERGGIVGLVIAVKPVEPELVTVPNVVRQPLERAVQMLKEAGLQPGTETPRPVKDIRPGTVVNQIVSGNSQLKAGSRVKRGTRIDLWVAVQPTGQEPAERAPTGTQPRKVLAKGGLEVRESYLFDLDRGKVVKNGDADFWFEAVTETERYLVTRNGATLGFTREKGDYESCSRVKMTERRIPIAKLPTTSYVCVRTNRGNLASFRLREPVGPSPGVLKIGYIVWE